MTTQDSKKTIPNSIFLMIPSFIADDVDIDDSTAMLYGRIMSLTFQKGYCWASDKYLAELSRVSDREVKNRLKTLKDKGYIRVETQKIGCGWDRKIYAVSAQSSFKNISTKGTGVPLEGNRCSQDIDKLNNISASAAPSLQEPPTPEPQVSQAREEALKQLTLDSRALNNARSSEHTDETVINAVARVLEYGKSDNQSAMLNKAIEQKWKPRETSTIKPQKKELEAYITSRLKALGAKSADVAAAAFLLKRDPEMLAQDLDEIQEMVHKGFKINGTIIDLLKEIYENPKR